MHEDLSFADAVAATLRPQDDAGRVAAAALLLVWKATKGGYAKECDEAHRVADDALRLMRTPGLDQRRGAPILLDWFTTRMLRADPLKCAPDIPETPP